MNRISIDFKKDLQGKLPLTARRVIDQMSINKALFPDPPPALNKLRKVIPEYETSLARAKNRDKYLVSVKNDLKAIVIDLLQELVFYVTVVSRGDKTTLLSSGFDVTNGSENSDKQPVIQKLQVNIEISGMAITQVKNVTNTIAFIHQYTTEPPTKDTIWVSEGSSLSRYTFEGLQPDKRYWFRVVAIGYYGLRGYSPVVSKVIQ